MKFRIVPTAGNTYKLEVKIDLAGGMSSWWHLVDTSPDIRYLRGSAERYKKAEEAEKAWLSQPAEEFEL